MNKMLYRLMNFAMAFVLAFGASFHTLKVSALDTVANGEQASLQSGNVYYVSTTGQDANPGTSTAPFRTFAKAVSILLPGDTLQVMPGTYIESLRMTASGTATAPITIIGNGAIVNMQGSKTTGIRISGNHVNLSGFEVTGATDAGIGIPGQYVTV